MQPQPQGHPGLPASRDSPSWPHTGLPTRTGGWWPARAWAQLASLAWGPFPYVAFPGGTFPFPTKALYGLAAPRSLIPGTFFFMLNKTSTIKYPRIRPNSIA